MKLLKSNLSIFCLLLTACFTANAQNNKNVAVKNFNTVSISSGIDLYLSQSTTEALTIKGDAELIKDVIVEQNGTNITIKYKEGINWGRLFKGQSIKAYVSYKTLTALTASGGADVYTQNTLKADALTIKASGGSDLELTLACKNLNLAVSGGSDADLKGTGENLVLNASGGSDVSASSFMVNYAKVSASGGADVDIYVNKGLEASASGGADINYKGNAALKKLSNSKSGDIRHVN